MTQVLEYITQNYTWFLIGAIVILLAVIGYFADKTNFGQGKNTDNNENQTPKKEKNLENVGLMDITSNMNKSSDNIQNFNSSEIANSSQTSNLTTNIDSNIQNLNSLSEEKGQLTKLYPLENGNSNNTKSEVDEGIANMQLPILENQKTSEVVAPSNTNNDEEKSEFIQPNSSNNSDSVINAINKELNLVNSNIVFDGGNLEYEEKEKQREEAFDKFNAEFNSLLPKKELISGDLLSEIDDLDLGKTQKLDLSDLPKLDNLKLPKISNTAKEEQDIWKF